MRNLATAVLAAALPLAGCGTMMGGGATAGGHSMTVSSGMPAAEATVRLGQAANDNTSIDLTVEHLAQPERLDPPANVYVVWTKPPEEQEAQNIGALKVDEDLTGRLTTVSPLHSFELFVTAEQSAQVTEPTGEPLLWTTFSR